MRMHGEGSDGCARGLNASARLIRAARARHAESRVYTARPTRVDRETRRVVISQRDNRARARASTRCGRDAGPPMAWHGAIIIPKAKHRAAATTRQGRSASLRFPLRFPLYPVANRKLRGRRRAIAAACYFARARVTPPRAAARNINILF